MILKAVKEIKQSNIMVDTQYKLKDRDNIQKVCINSNQIKFQHGDEKEKTKYHLYPKSFLQLTDTHWQRENWFSPISPSLLTTCQGKPQAQE